MKMKQKPKKAGVAKQPSAKKPHRRTRSDATTNKSYTDAINVKPQSPTRSSKHQLEDKQNTATKKVLRSQDPGQNDKKSHSATSRSSPPETGRKSTRDYSPPTKCPKLREKKKSSPLNNSRNEFQRAKKDTNTLADGQEARHLRSSASASAVVKNDKQSDVVKSRSVKEKKKITGVKSKQVNDVKSSINAAVSKSDTDSAATKKLTSVRRKSGDQNGIKAPGSKSLSKTKNSDKLGRNISHGHATHSDSEEEVLDLRRSTRSVQVETSLGPSSVVGKKSQDDPIKLKSTITEKNTHSSVKEVNHSDSESVEEISDDETSSEASVQSQDNHYSEDQSQAVLAKSAAERPRKRRLDASVDLSDRLVRDAVSHLTQADAVKSDGRSFRVISSFSAKNIAIPRPQQRGDIYIVSERPGKTEREASQEELHRIIFMLKRQHQQEEMRQRAEIENLRKKLTTREEEIARLKNEVSSKIERLDEMEELVQKNVELEAKINLVMADPKRYKEENEAFEKERLRIQAEEKQKEEKKKVLKEKSPRKKRGKGETEETGGPDEIDALFVGDDDAASDVEVVGEKKTPKAALQTTTTATAAMVDDDVIMLSGQPALIKDHKNFDSQEDEKWRHGRREIRRLMPARKLHDETVKAAKEEKERQKRMQEEHDKHVKVVKTDQKTKTEICTTLALATDEDSKKHLVKVDKDILKYLKPHQVDAVEFLWDNAIESLEKYESEPGNGCILAHCMGLGKTLSLISFVHTLMTTEALRVRTCLVVCPLNTIFNWIDEWHKWQPDQSRIQVYVMATASNNHERAALLREWHDEGGVLVMGYSLFRILVNYKGRSRKNREAFNECLLDPGPDIVVCDEGHMLKNDASLISKAMNRILTKRRVVMTGTPVQNNLIEYHCMVSFVKPNLLGTQREFCNRFVNPITNGQHSDSTSSDVKLMKRRSYVLHEMLKGCVQRRDYSCLTHLLPPKHEYVISVRLSELQIELYSKYLELFCGQAALAAANPVPAGGKPTPLMAARLFADYQALLRVWSHPWLLRLDEERQEKKALEYRDDELDESDEELLLSSSDEEEIEVENTVDEDDDDSEESSESSDSVQETDEDLPSKLTTMVLTDIAKSAATKVATRSSRRNKGKVNGDKTDKKVVENSKEEKGSSKNQGKKEVVKQDKEVKKKGKDTTTDAVPKPENETRKAKVLAGEIIRKWKSSSRGGGTAPLEAGDLGSREPAWWSSLVTEEQHMRNLEISGKLMLLFEILRMAQTIGDKVLVFSQSLLTLDLIETFLQYKTEQVEQDHPELKERKGSVWKKDLDYLRMDGSTVAQTRAKHVENFNNKTNSRLRLFLISTKAGGLGINLDAANRVIIFDASWNPSHDIQSIFRVYRFGQKKPVHIYRFLAQGTMEDKIYGRQVTKETLAHRVVDEQQIDRHFTAADLRELYLFKPENWDPDATRPTPAMPKDVLLAELLTTQRRWIVSYHEHDSLLEKRPEEDLDEAERKAAWDEYERERHGLYSVGLAVPRTQTLVQQTWQQPRIQTIPNQPTKFTVHSIPSTAIPKGAIPIPPSLTRNMPDAAATLPKVVEEILKYNPDIGPEELESRLAAFLGMQSRGKSRQIAHAIFGNGEESSSASLPSRLPQPGKVPGSALPGSTHSGST